MGFSHNTALPALAAPTIRSIWLAGGVAISTAPTAASPNAASASRATFASCFAASSRAFSPSTSCT